MDENPSLITSDLAEVSNWLLQTRMKDRILKVVNAVNNNRAAHRFHLALRRFKYQVDFLLRVTLVYSLFVMDLIEVVTYENYRREVDSSTYGLSAAPPSSRSSRSTEVTTT